MIGHVKDTKSVLIESLEAKNAVMKVLVSPKEGWDDYVMRLVEVAPGGYTPKHNHPWPHINFMVEGRGELLMDGEYQSVNAGSYAYVPGNMEHQFRNNSHHVFKFICIVPKEGHKL